MSHGALRSQIIANKHITLLLELRNDVLEVEDEPVRALLHLLTHGDAAKADERVRTARNVARLHKIAQKTQNRNRERSAYMQCRAAAGNFDGTALGRTSMSVAPSPTMTTVL